MAISRRKFIASSALGLMALTFGKRLAMADGLEKSGLADLYRDDFLLGTMVEPETFVREDEKLLEIVTKEFNALATENVFKWDQIHPTDDHWNWVYSDEFVDFGERYGMHILGHPLLWHSQLPRGLFKDDGNQVTREILLSKVENHISTIVDRYKGRVHAWDVVNEIIDDEGSLVSNRWQQLIGDDYAKSAFHYAREADSNATLIYNDYNLWLPKKRDRMVSMLETFHKEGVPVDAVGLQCHIGLDYPDIEQLDVAINEFYRQGVRVHISEMDIDVLPEIEPGSYPGYRQELDPYRDGLPQSVSEDLANRYAQMFQLFSKHKDKIDRITLWGTTDDQSWKNDFPVEGRTNHTLLFDRDRNPKLAYDAVANLKR